MDLIAARLLPAPRLKMKMTLTIYFCFTQALSSLVHGDCYQPSAELSLASECSQAAESINHGFLCTVFGIRLIFEDGKNGHIDEALVGLDQLMEKIGFPGQDSGN